MGKGQNVRGRCWVGIGDGRWRQYGYDSDVSVGTKVIYRGKLIEGLDTEKAFDGDGDVLRVFGGYSQTASTSKQRMHAAEGERRINLVKTHPEER